MASPISKYSFINAKLRARISKILPDETFAELAKAPTLDAAFVLLRQTPFAELEEVYAETGDLKQAELEILKEEVELYKNMRRQAHPDSKPLIEALLYRFELDNLKNAIRVNFDSKLRKKGFGAGVHYLLHETIVHDIPIDVIINASNYDEIAQACSSAPYSEIIRNYGPTVDSEQSLFRLEIALDHWYYENLNKAIATLSRSDRSIAERLIGAEIDLQNINWLIRFKNFYNLPLQAVLAAIVPGGYNMSKDVFSELYTAENVNSVLQQLVKGKYPAISAMLASQTPDSTSRLLLIKRILQEIMNQEVKRILRGYPFTIGIVLAYLVLKMDELRRVRTVLNAKLYGIQPERIEGLL